MGVHHSVGDADVEEGLAVDDSEGVGSHDIGGREVCGRKEEGIVDEIEEVVDYEVLPLEDLLEVVPPPLEVEVLETRKTYSEAKVTYLSAIQKIREKITTMAIYWVTVKSSSPNIGKEYFCLHI